jgi:hypothetical protein
VTFDDEQQHLHREVWQLIPWLVNGTASADEHSLGERHLQGCGDCRDEFALQSRIRAGLDIDGNVESPLLPDPIALWPVARHGLDRPFMVMGDPGTDHHRTPSWKMLWDNSDGWHADVHLSGARGEDSYKDAVPLIPQIARQLGLPGSYVTGILGTIDPARAVRTEETFVAAFFDRWLRGRDGHVLDGPSARFPDVTFVP